jgi:predicted TPR repeat methyltransferase
MSTLSPLQQALMLMQQQAYSDAQAICAQLLARKPDDFNARHLLGLIHLQAGEPHAARAALEHAASLPVGARFRAQALSNLSLALGQLEQPEPALDAIEQALRLEPDEPAFHLNRLNLLEQLGRWHAILEAARQWPALTGEPDAQYALVRAERECGHTQQALQRLQPWLEDAPAELLGEWVLLQMQQHADEPIAAQVAAQHPQQLAFIADYLAEQGALTGALALYRELLARDPDHPGARHMIDAAEGHIAAAAPEHYVSGLYDTHASRFEQHLVGRLGYNAPTRLAAALARHLDGPIGRVADLGCGSGLMGVALKSHFEISELLGCDLSGGMLEQARRKGLYDRLEQAELARWLAGQQPFDLICATDVLIYTGDLAPVMAAVAPRLSEGGWFAFTVERSDRELEITPSGRYRHGEQHIRARADACGLELVSCEAFPLRRENDRQLTGLMALCRRTREPRS